MLGMSTLVSCNSPLLPLNNRHNFTTLAQYPCKKAPIFLTGPTKYSNLHGLYHPRTVTLQKGAVEICEKSINKKKSNIAISAQYPCKKGLGFLTTPTNPSNLLGLHYHRTLNPQKGALQICQSSINTKVSVEEIGFWGMSLLLWGNIVYENFIATLNYNPVMSSLLSIAPLWLLAYSMLLIPTVSRKQVPAWPFFAISIFGSLYALMPYLLLWKQTPTPIKETELRKWPVNFLESKITAAISLAAGLGLITYAGLASGENWAEFIQYVEAGNFFCFETINFAICSAFAPFCVYNDMIAREWYDKGWWLIPVSLLIPFLGPALYLLLRPSLDNRRVLFGKDRVTKDSVEGSEKAEKAMNEKNVQTKDRAKRDSGEVPEEALNVVEEMQTKDRVTRDSAEGHAVNVINVEEMRTKGRATGDSVEGSEEVVNVMNEKEMQIKSRTIGDSSEGPNETVNVLIEEEMERNDYTFATPSLVDFSANVSMPMQTGCSS